MFKRFKRFKRFNHPAVFIDKINTKIYIYIFYKFINLLSVMM